MGHARKLGEEEGAGAGDSSAPDHRLTDRSGELEFLGLLLDFGTEGTVKYPRRWRRVAKYLLGAEGKCFLAGRVPVLK